MGGLGNQLFQYAFGKSIAIKNNDTLFLDLSYYEQHAKNDTKRSFELKHFDINYKIANEEILNLFINDNFDFKNRFLCKLNSFNRYKKIKEVSKDFDYRLIKNKGNLYYKGYFQNEQYFENINDILIDEFKIIKPLNDEYKPYLEQILATKSIFIHVRKTDFTNSLNKLQFDIVKDDFYLDSIKKIEENNKDAVFFCFSDDISYCKALFKSNKNIIFVEVKNANSVDEFNLMSQCKNSIFGNSTFAWWANWINKNKK
jgi:hypothetical protein